MIIPFYRYIENVLFPPFCSYCRSFLSERTIFCSDCYTLIKPVVSVSLPVTKNFSMSVSAISYYEYPLKQLVLAKHWSYRLASLYIAQLMWEHTIVSQIPFDYIVPIPLHWTRFAWRGYNQAHIIANYLSAQSGKPVLPLLKRARRTIFQSQLPIEQRENNVKEAFVLNGVIEPNAHIVLVDDLMTTGSTLRAAAKTLLSLKPSYVSGVVGCRAR